MKLVFIINSLGGGGAERVLQTLSTYFAKQNHEIYIILLEKDSNQYQLHENINIEELKCHF